MPDLYDAIASGNYGRSYDRWERVPDFDEITALDEDEHDGEAEDYSLIDKEYDDYL